MKQRLATNIALTGYAGVGKTTLIRDIARQLADHGPIGFYTSEIREKGVRMGFELNSLDGVRTVFAHVDKTTGVRVGRYGVDIDTFETFLDRLRLEQADRKLIVIDEVGRMECFSPKFVSLVARLLESDRVVVTTVAMRGSGLIRKIKRRDDTVLFEVTIVNRGRLHNEILAATRAALDA